MIGVGDEHAGEQPVLASRFVRVAQLVAQHLDGRLVLVDELEHRHRVGGSAGVCGRGRGAQRGLHLLIALGDVGEPGCGRGDTVPVLDRLVEIA